MTSRKGIAALGVVVLVTVFFLGMTGTAIDVQAETVFDDRFQCHDLTVLSAPVASVPFLANEPEYAGDTPKIISCVSPGESLILAAPEQAEGVPFSDWSGCDSQVAANCLINDLDSDRQLIMNFDRPLECPSCPEPSDATVSITEFFAISGSTVVGADGVITVTRGAALSFRWKAPGAVSCAGSGLPLSSWTQTRDPFTRSDVVISTAGLPEPVGMDTYSMTLTCTNAELVEQVALTLQVEESQPAPHECVSVPSLTHASGGFFTRATVLVDDSGAPQDGTEFSAVFLAPFPGTSNQRRLRLVPNQYAAIRFDTPADLSAAHNGIFQAEPLIGYNTATRLMSISRCPGDFNVENLEPGCIRSLSGTDGFRWQGISHATRCALEPGQTYYLNFVYTDAPVGTPPSQITPGCVPGSIGYCGNLHTHVFSYP